MLFEIELTDFFQLIRKEKGPFIEYEENVQPILIVQIIDNEFACSDEFLGKILFTKSK